jgi:ketosteroid isomerase-like protein
MAGMERAAVEDWVAAYERAWRDDDVAAVETLFSPDAAYRTSPYDEPAVGHEAIKDLWLDDQGRTFTMDYSVVAVDGDVAVVRLQVSYGDPAQEYCDLWVLRFATDGRVAEYEEWATWPEAGPESP